VDRAIKVSGIRPDEIDAVAFTRGPGLMGSLLVGTSFAKGLSISLGKPLIEINHLQAHILANFILEKDTANAVPGFPFLCLLVSGGHTQLVLVKDYLDMEIIGQMYEKWRQRGLKKEDARFVLPNACATEFVVSANFREWRHILKSASQRRHSGNSAMPAGRYTRSCSHTPGRVLRTSPNLPNKGRLGLFLQN
jgi:hypothetical protein